MVNRLDMQEGLKADMHTWHYEATDKIYDTLPKYYKKLAEYKDAKEIKGGFWKGTSAIGATELVDRENGGQYHEDHPQEGFTVWGTLKDKALTVKCPRELRRDWHKTANWLRQYGKENWPEAVEYTKEKIVANFYNYGGYTAGNAVFNQEDADIPVTCNTSPNLAYDNKPFFTLSGNNRTAKSDDTYYNALALTGVNYANSKTMWNLLTTTNNKKENGQPFNNARKVSVACHPSLLLDWQVVANSTLNPDNAENAHNPLKTAFNDIIPNEHFLTSTFSCMFREGLGIKFWCGAPRFNYWEENNPESEWASVIMDYAITVQNFRTHVSNNAPTSA